MIRATLPNRTGRQEWLARDGRTEAVQNLQLPSIEEDDQAEPPDTS